MPTPTGSASISVGASPSITPTPAPIASGTATPTAAATPVVQPAWLAYRASSVYEVYYNEAVATVDPVTGKVTPVAEGTFNVTVAPFTYPDGTPVLEADGVTPFPVPAPAAVTVSAGAAVAASLVLSV